MIPHKETMERYNLPAEVKYCKRCTMSNQRPRITFNAEGICSACQFAEIKNKTDWHKREDEMRKLCGRFRRKDGYYDVIVPSSGGKDSGLVAHKIRDGHITREEGVALVRKYDGEFPERYFNEFLEYCEIDENHFYELVDSWRFPHLWERLADGTWTLKYQVS